MPFDRNKFFDMVRHDPFPDELTQQQVDGMNLMLDYFEDEWERTASNDLRWLAYILATAKWETAHTMQPIEEYGHGEGHEYGKADPETHQTYYGRGLVQLTWRDNYRNATAHLGLTGDDDLEWHAAQALDPTIATAIIFEGMREGWFTGKMLPDFFNEAEDDPVGARQIVNDHDHDDDIAEIHHGFLLALQGASVPELPRVVLSIKVPDGVAVSISINDVPLIMSPRG